MNSDNQNSEKNITNDNQSKISDATPSEKFNIDDVKKKFNSKDNEIKNFLKSKKRIEKLIKDLAQLDANRKKITDELSQLQSIFK